VLVLFQIHTVTVTPFLDSIRYSYSFSSYLFFVVSRLSSIGYELFMIFFSTSDLVCSLRQLLVLYLSFVTLLTFGVRVAPCYVPSTSSFMPVTTRSQSKRLNNVNRDHSFYSTLGSSLSSRMSATFSECNLTTTTAVTVSSCNNNTTTSSHLDISTINLEQLDVTNNNCPLFHSSVSSPVSKFQNFKFVLL